MRSYSPDLRERIVEAVEGGASMASVARTFRVSYRTVQRYVARKKTTGDLAQRIGSGRPRRISFAQQVDLIAQLDSAPDATLEEHSEAWKQSHGVRVSIATMHRSIKRAGWTLKKRL
jgi:transposase